MMVLLKLPKLRLRFEREQINDDLLVALAASKSLYRLAGLDSWSGGLEDLFTGLAAEMMGDLDPTGGLMGELFPKFFPTYVPRMPLEERRPVEAIQDLTPKKIPSSEKIPSKGEVSPNPNAKEALANDDEVVSLDLRDTTIGDKGVKALAQLKNLHTLALGGTKVSDASMKEIAGLQNLHTLDLNSTKVAEASVKEIVKLTKLHTLDLGGIRLTEAARERAGRLEKTAPAEPRRRQGHPGRPARIERQR